MNWLEDVVESLGGFERLVDDADEVTDELGKFPPTSWSRLEDVSSSSTEGEAIFPKGMS